MLATSVIDPTRNEAFAMAFYRSIRQSLASPVIAASEHFWPRFRCSPLRLKTAASFGSRDYDLRLALRFSPTPLLRHGVGRVCLHLRSSTLFDGCTLANTDTSGCAYGVGSLPFRCQPDDSACYSEPSMPVCFVPSSNRADAILSAAFLPPIEEEAASITSPRHGNFHLSSATLCPPQAPMHGAPMHRLRSGCRPTTSFTPSYLRLRARAGRHIVLVQAHDKVPVAPCLRDTCRLL